MNLFRTDPTPEEIYSEWAVDDSPRTVITPLTRISPAAFGRGERKPWWFWPFVVAACVLGAGVAILVS